ncbi:disintegrin and metalloproteinase domain-containing protein 10 [Plakobranchus ocellatus]|uniref:Disintegrin and metalloproteinase domain-containing protein 10 n=1 Tax=Plakobranchus ocellatus TaxID=259542 RepID=A0AAV4CRZ4_9GAST|nr:disintegrin and metalloproteinase domain-containing protein 10 [Plakobranchus ocellatus]
MFTVFLELLVVTLTINIRGADGTGYCLPPYSSINLCDRTWSKIFENGPTGAPLHGSKNDLKQAILRGAEVRVLMQDMNVEPSNMVTHTFSSGLDNINMRGDNICGEILSHISTNHHESHVDAQWRFFLPCTTGSVHVAMYLVESSDFISEETLKVRIAWFVKEIQHDLYNNRPLYAHFLDGGSTVGSKDDLLDAATQGKEIRAIMTDRGYAFPFQVVAWSKTDRRVAGQSNKHLSQRYQESDILYNTGTPYMWFSTWTTTGRRDSSRWAVGGVTNRGRGSDYVSLQWFADPCWRHVYTHDAQGVQLRGSRESLVAAIKDGHRVRVVVDDRAMEAAFLRIKNGHVSAYFLDEMSCKGGEGFDKFDFTTDTYIKFSTAHTTGTFRQYGHFVRNKTNTVNPSLTKQQISWMIDVKPWETILKVSDKGRVTWGSKANVKNAVMKSAALRMAIQFDSTTGTMYLSADNTKVPTAASDEDSTSQSVRVLGDRPIGDFEFELSPVAFWVFMVVPTTGNVHLSGWQMGKHQRFFHLSVPAQVSWFANL